MSSSPFVFRMRPLQQKSPVRQRTGLKNSFFLFYTLPSSTLIIRFVKDKLKKACKKFASLEKGKE